MNPIKLTFLAALSLLFVACGGGGGDSADDSTGAPESILGRTVSMTVESVEIIADPTAARFLSSGDNVTMTFADATTIYTDEKLNGQMEVDSWDYNLSGNTGTLNLYQPGGEHHMEYNFSDSTSGTYSWDLESISGSKVLYKGTFTVKSDSKAAACLDDYYSGSCIGDFTFAEGRSCADAFPEAEASSSDCSTSASGSGSCGACLLD